MTQATTEQLAVVNGRDGIKLPDLNAEPWKGTLGDYDPLHFFHQLWEANGYNTSVRYGHDSYLEGPRPYSHELVVSPDTTKPLAVVRGRFEPRDSKAIETENIVNRARWVEYDRPNTATGQEIHEIMVPPRQLGGFAVRWRVTQAHIESNGSSRAWSHYDGPQFSEFDSETGEQHDIRPFDFYPDDTLVLSPKEREAKRTEAYSEAIRHALTAAVELLS